MTPDEFDEWKRKHFALFPEQREEIHNLLRNESDRVEWSVVWYDEVFAHVPFGDAVSASKWAFANRPEYFRATLVPSFVRDFCHRASVGRYEKSETERVTMDGLGIVGTMQSLGTLDVFKGLLAERRAARGMGRDADAAGRAFLAAHFDKLPDDRRDAVKCVDCRDTGLIRVYHPDSMLAARVWVKGITQELKTGDLRSVHCACVCEAGGKRNLKSRRLLTWVSDGRMVRWSDDHETLKSWASSYEPWQSDDFGEYGRFE